MVKSTDGGALWDTLMLGQSIRALAIDPTMPAVVYAGTARGAVEKSVDGGVHWATLDTGAAGSVEALAIDPATPTTVYLGATTPGDVRRSTDGGATWSAANTGIPDLLLSGPLQPAFALAADPTSPATVYAATGTGLFKSTDNGATWVATAVMATPAITSLAIDPLEPTTLYAGRPSGVAKSTDSGATWSGVDSGPVIALAIDPLAPSTVYAGFDAAPPCRPLRPDGGPPCPLFGGVEKSIDGGAHWTNAYDAPEILDIPVNALAIHPVRPSTVYAGTPYGVFKSRNAARTWSPAAAPGSVVALAIDPTRPTTIYAGGRGVFKSADGGACWTRLAGGPHGVTALAVVPELPGTVYAGTDDRGVFRSTDAGGTWAAINAGLGNRSVRALAIGEATVHAATDGGVFERALVDGPTPMEPPAPTTSTTLPMCSPSSDDCDGDLCTAGDTCNGAGCLPGSQLTTATLRQSLLEDMRQAKAECASERRKLVRNVFKRLHRVARHLGRATKAGGGKQPAKSLSRAQPAVCGARRDWRGSGPG